MPGDWINCRHCNGAGTIIIFDHETKRNIKVRCNYCNGTGKESWGK